MRRKRKEWVGASDDSPLPQSTYAALWRAQNGKCGKCGRRLRPGQIIREHVKPLWAGGENRESNIQLWCAVPCSSDKTGEETSNRTRGDRQLKRHLGLKTKQQLKARPLPGTKRSGWKHKVNGTWERR